MTFYTYLVVYPESVKTPAHWAVLVTATENGKVGQEFQAIGSPFHGFNLEVNKEFDLTKELKKHSCVFLGTLDDSWNSQLAGVAQSVAAPGISSTPLDPFAGENCQSWARQFIQSLIDRGALGSSAMERLDAAPRV